MTAVSRNLSSPCEPTLPAAAITAGGWLLSDELLLSVGGVGVVVLAGWFARATWNFVVVGGLQVPSRQI